MLTIHPSSHNYLAVQTLLIAVETKRGDHRARARAIGQRAVRARKAREAKRLPADHT